MPASNVRAELVMELASNYLHDDPTPSKHNDSQLRGTQGSRCYIKKDNKKGQEELRAV